jgi:hypothetical protein
MTRILLSWCCCFLVVQTLPRVSAAEPAPLQFNRDIRPILSQACFQCHGPDDKKRDSDLRLDTREGAIADLGGYAAIVPGKPEQSKLLERVTAHDVAELMPPPESKKPRLTEPQIKTLTRWIKEGAEYQGHWAFQALADLQPPEIKDKAWTRNAIDRFILQKLEQEGIKPSAPADRATLIRRVYLDLLGLLPSPEEVTAFVDDKRPDAWEHLIERLLASPHYGERWGRHWLDQARYADSDGYSIDGERAMWPYRDWVIAALNKDMPFDQFTIEQLAGDLLPNSTKSQQIATAFHRNTLINAEGGTDREQFRNEAVVDRVNTTGAVWLGLTVGCAQCHTHKFDPITHREYYQLFSFFNQTEDVNNKGPTVPVVRGEMFGRPISPEPEGETPQELAKRRGEWEKRELAKLAAAGNNKPAEWNAGEYVEFESESNAGLRKLDDGSLLADGRGASSDVYRLVLRPHVTRVAAIRLTVIPHESLPHNGPGLSPSGNFVLTDFELKLDDKEIAIASVTADAEQSGFPVANTIDDKEDTGWGINMGKANWHSEHSAVFVLKEPLPIEGKAVEIRLSQKFKEHFLIGRFALAFSATVPPKKDADPELAALLRIKAADRTAAQEKQLTGIFNKAEKPPAKKVADTAASERVNLMVMKDIPKPRETFIQLRGDFLRLDKETGVLNPGVLKAVNVAYKTPPTSFANRLDLARWLVNAENPLTPRVAMNRVWLRYFGRGLVDTDEDFGTQGTYPSHPELLDWLAREWIRNNWSLKAMHRLIVNSATYRQSSQSRPELVTNDPLNRWLARQSRIRVEGEIARDLALTASGLLTREIGGPSVRPPQPEGVYAFTQNKKTWTAATGADRYRRGMYTVFFRSAPYPLLTTFDAPDFQLTCTRRSRSNTPLQALTIANDEAFVEIARGLAERVLREVPEEKSGAIGDAQLRRTWELCLQRVPNDKELSILRAYATRQQTELAKDPAAAKQLLSPALAKSTASPESTAALVSVARTILNLDQFITRE